MKERSVQTIGWFASLCAILLNLSYIDQIRLNLSGHPGSAILPFFAVLNGTVWTFYGFCKPQKDWPIIVCNIVGIILGATMAITAII